MPLLTIEVPDAEDVAVMAEALRSEGARWRKAAELGAREVEAERRAKVDVRTASLRIVAALGRAATLDALAEQVGTAVLLDGVALAGAATQTPAGGGGGEAPPPAGQTPAPQQTPPAAAAPAQPIVLPEDPRAAETVRRLAAAQGVPVIEPGGMLIDRAALAQALGEPTPEDDTVTDPLAGA